MSAGPAARPAGLALRNPKVQRLRRLARDPRARREARAFVLEGHKLVAAALAAGSPVEAVFVAPGGEGPLVERARVAGAAVHRLAPGVVERVADTATPQPVVAVAHTVDGPMGDLRAASLVVVCVDVRDPGNLGTVIRSAQAAGAAGVVCCDGTADVYNPKAVRASAGALFHLRLVVGGAAGEVLSDLGSWGVRRLGARASGGEVYHRTDLTVPTALVLGNESRGLAPEVEDLLDGPVSIPMAAGAESLNVGAAAAVLCFEVARQRRP